MKQNGVSFYFSCKCFSGGLIEITDVLHVQIDDTTASAAVEMNVRIDPGVKPVGAVRDSAR